MISSQSVWLYDEKGYQPLNPMFLSTIGNLVNDPYRTLAWQARRGGAFAKADVNYLEFMWANFFRESIPFNSAKPLGTPPVSWNWCQTSPFSFYKCDLNENEELARILPIALALAKTDAAKYLPGWGNGTVDPIDCTQPIEFA